MNKEKEPQDIILRDYLAVDRTRLANQRTLLSMIRTGLYFEVAGITLMTIDQFSGVQRLAPLLLIVGIVFIGFGFFNYVRMNKRIQKMYQSKRP